MRRKLERPAPPRGIVAACALLMVCLLPGCDEGERNGNGAGAAASTPSTAVRGSAGQTAALPIHKVTAERFAAEHSADRDAAATKYANALIELSGTVKDLQFNYAGDPFVNLTVGNERIGVQCFTKDQAPWAKLARGQRVTLRGAWPELALVPSLKDCEFIEVGPSTAVTITAKELADEYAKGADAALQKYAEKTLLVSGEVDGRSLQPSRNLVLKGSDTVKVRCDFSSFEREPKTMEGVKIGQRVTIHGDLSGVNKQDGTAMLSGSRLMPE